MLSVYPSVVHGNFVRENEGVVQIVTRYLFTEFAYMYIVLTCVFL